MHKDLVKICAKEYDNTLINSNLIENDLLVKFFLI